MTIKKTRNESGGETVAMTHCPICGEELYKDNNKVTHLQTHDISEFGL